MKRWSTWLAAALLAVPASSHAQGSDEPLQKKYDVQLQGGMGGWTGNAANVTSNVGPAYGVLGAYNAYPWLAYELGYTGISNGLDNSSGRLAANRIQGDVKAGPQLVAPIPWRPYAFAGLAANFVHAGESPAGFTNSFEAEIPMGAGADFFTNYPIRVGARAGFNFNPGIGGDLGPVSSHPSSWQTVVTTSGTF